MAAADEGGAAAVAAAPAPAVGGKKKNRPAGLAPLIAAAEVSAPVNSYRVENDGTFIHGRLQITGSGVQLAAGGSAADTGSGAGAGTPSVASVGKSLYSSLSLADTKIAAAPVAASVAAASLTKPKAHQSYTAGAGVGAGGTHHHPNPSVANGTDASAVAAAAAAGGMGTPGSGRLAIAKLEDLTVLDKLGEGNSSSVYRAVHTPTGRLVAVKQIRIHEREKRHQIMKEVTTLFECDSKYLITFHGAFFKAADDTISVVLELMDAGSLCDVLSVVKHYPEPVLACVAYQVCKGLAYLQARKQVHRDIKPANICVNSHGEVRITDFGIAAQLADTLAAAQTFVGTHLYMSPKRLEGKSYSYASDIWAVGVTLYECAAGHNPFAPPKKGKAGGIAAGGTAVAGGAGDSVGLAGGDFVGLFEAVVRGRLPDCSAFSADFQSFVALCLAKDPAKRPAAADLCNHPFIVRNVQTFYKKQFSAWLRDKLKLPSPTGPVPPHPAVAAAATAAAPTTTAVLAAAPTDITALPAAPPALPSNPSDSGEAKTTPATTPHSSAPSPVPSPVAHVVVASPVGIVGVLKKPPSATGIAAALGRGKK